MKPVLIFDLDDTLILQDLMTKKTVEYCTAFLGLAEGRFWEVFRQTSQKAFEALPTYSFCKNLGISAQEGLWGQFGGPLPELNQMRRLIPGYRFQAWHEALKLCGFPEESLAQKIADDFAELRGRRYYAFPEARAVLESLKPRFDLAILTNGAPELQWSKIHSSGLEDLFDSVTVSGDYGIGKPRRELFEAVFAKHPGQRQFLMIGNSLTSDIQGAANAGIPSVLFLQGDEPPAAGIQAQAVISNLRELEAVLPGLLKNS